MFAIALKRGPTVVRSGIRRAEPLFLLNHGVSLRVGAAVRPSLAAVGASL
jgi:hypothetical protein